MENPQYFAYTCPHCHGQTNAIQVAAALPDEILRTEAARRNGRQQSPHAGPGRPTVVRCPGCDEEMSTAELRQHRVQCVYRKLREIHHLSLSIHLAPKDPDPRPDFHITQLGPAEVEFKKGNCDNLVTIDLRKIAEITISLEDKRAYIRLLGRIIWRDDIKRWRFAPSQVGRPQLASVSR